MEDGLKDERGRYLPRYGPLPWERPSEAGSGRGGAVWNPVWDDPAVAGASAAG